MTIIVFEDPQCEMLAPITLARLAATITCGSFRLVDLLSLIEVDLFGKEECNINKGIFASDHYGLVAEVTFTNE